MVDSGPGIWMDTLLVSLSGTDTNHCIVFRGLVLYMDNRTRGCLKVSAQDGLMGSPNCRPTGKQRRRPRSAMSRLSPNKFIASACMIWCTIFRQWSGLLSGIRSASGRASTRNRNLADLWKVVSRPL